MRERRRRTRLLHWSDWPLLAKGLVVVCLPLLALLTSRLAAGRSQLATQQAQRVIQLTRNQERQIDAVTLSLVNAETGVRGYLLTNDESFLTPYRAAQGTLGPQLDRLEATIRSEGDDVQLNKITWLRALAGNELTILNELVRTDDSLSESDRAAALDSGKGVLDQVRTLLADMNRHERAQEVRETLEATRVQSQTRLLIAIGFPIGLLGGLLGLLLFATSISRRVHRVRDNAGRLARGERIEPAPSQSQDVIGELEQAVGRADEVLAERQASLALALEAGRLGLFEIDVATGAIFSPSPDRLKTLGLAHEHELETIDDLILATHQADRLWVAGTWERFLVRGGTLDTEFRLETADAQPRWVALRARIDETEEGPRVIGAVFDVTDRKTDEAERQRLYAEVEQHRQELAKLSITDDVTNLLNRRGFHLLAEHEIGHADRAGTDLLLLFADLDGLKSINDTHGHAVGTQALIDMADVLRATFRGSDVIARFGGDEFCILLSRSLAGVSDMKVVDRLQRAIRERNANGDRPFRLSASVGACRRPSGSSLTLDQMTKRADELMYQEKHRRRVARTSAPAGDSIVRV
jgi:diguanylate cyclase (GGDEF)-like protein